MRTIRLFALGLMLLLFNIRPLVAQTTELPPAIVSFFSDTFAANFNDVEAGRVQTTFTWRTVNLSANYRLVLETYVANQWLSVSEGMSANNSLTTTLRHPLNFGPPTYRLSIVNGRRQVIDQNIIAIPYTVAEPAPFVQSFTTTTVSVDPTDLSLRTARINISWDVMNRPPGSNIIFEQLYEDGTSVSVELPRPVLWISSSGQGVVAPVIPPVGTFVRLRMRVVNMSNGEVYVESEVAVPIIKSTPTPSPTSTSTLTPTPTTTPTSTWTPLITPTPTARSG